ncbi:hypothetical protein CDAR_79481 [Caerostris darwini]|uniref:Uncharacterized protein n=1 Tax=Caerostris darwini TaxID=1538125 RepID=A0AAV4UHX7_9ARAC|nr:hypothetical protein CDAR_79481 [Caerostris darwini]
MLRSNIDVSKGLVNGNMGFITEIIWTNFRRDQVYAEDIPRMSQTEVEMKTSEVLEQEMNISSEVIKVFEQVINFEGGETKASPEETNLEKGETKTSPEEEMKTSPKEIDFENNSKKK